MMITRAGDCLSFGLGTELMTNMEFNMDVEPNINLKAVVTYFALTYKISGTTARDINKELSQCAHDFSQIKSKFIYISDLIVRDLKKYYQFADFDELVNQLNEILIPDWVFGTRGKLLQLFPQAYLLDELIYYMKEDEGRYYFRCVHISQVEELMRYSQDLFMDFDTDSIPEEEYNHTISNRYSEIIGFNEVSRIFYLRLHHTNMLYAEYHADTGQEIIYHNNCIGVIENMPIVKRDNQLCVAFGANDKCIKELDILEDYQVKNNMIYVYPAFNMPVMFRPYIVTPIGEIMEMPQKEVLEYVLEKIKSNICDYRDYFSGRGRDKSIFDDNKLSLDNMDSLLKKYDLMQNKIARMYHSLVRILKDYLPSDEDVIDYFFMLADVSKRMFKEGTLDFIQVSVFWCLYEFHSSGKLSGVINDIDKLKELLMQDVYWDDETIIREKGDRYSGERIGYFFIDNNKVVSDIASIDEAICIGDMLMAPKKERPGIVALNLETGVYEIQYTRELTKGEVLTVLNVFHLDDVAYRISIDKCRNS